GTRSRRPLGPREAGAVTGEFRMSQPVDGPAVERQVVTDMIRRAVPVIPLIVLVAGLIWGVDGALSAGFGVGLVLLNLALSAAILASAARISLTALMGAALLGYLLRLALITVA